MFHQWIALAILGLLALAGIGLTIVGIGGTFLILIGAALYNLITWSMTITVNTFLWLAGLAIAGEILEWIITLAGVKAAGVSRHALMGTIVGAVIGGIALSVVPIIGTIIGIVLGAMLGAFLLEFYHGKNAQKAWKAAKAALLGRLAVSITKFVLAIIQIAIIYREVF